MNELLVTVEKINGILVTTSNRVAEELGVRHDHLLNKIDDYINKFSSPKLSGQFYIPSEYQTANNRTARNYLITKKGIAQLIGGYSSAVEKAFDLNVAYINRFEEMEKQISTGVPQNFKEALRLALEQEEKIEALQLDNKVKGQQIAELQPKATYYDLVLQCKEILSIGVIAKDFGIKSAQEFNKLLHEWGIQYNQSGVWLLYSKYSDKGYTQTKTQNYPKSDGSQGVKLHTYWTQKGRLFLYELLKSKGYIPNIEKEYGKEA
ncbi:phage regulatory protein/antirepressor Ant [Fusobacterium ulcerans]|uniref:phage regulatory protein/antirepressor Ant n=1 Tax=Fusobacterium ulcerans TaxID=861 RepID=UPI003FEFD8C7